MSARLVAVIQARMSSSRLPGKVLRDLGGEPVLAWVVRAALASGLDDVVVATSVDASDDRIERFCHGLGVQVVRGPLDDVLSRFVLAAESSDADAVVRLTADCPLLDPEVIRGVAGVWRARPDLDYVSTTLVRRLPRGLDVELVATGALRRVAGHAVGHDRVHVTSGVYADPAAFALAEYRPSADDFSRFRVTLDEPADAHALDALVRLLPERPPRWRDVVTALEANPAVVALNAAVQQKGLAEG
jgi:spore coat polysaccharide biosynthesis protein SpsF